MEGHHLCIIPEMLVDSVDAKVNEQLNEILRYDSV